MKTHKTLLALCCVLALCIGGCTLPTPNKNNTEPQETYADALKYHDEYREHLQFQHLNESQQHAYGMLYTSVKDAVHTDATVPSDDDTLCPGIRVPLDSPLDREEMSQLYESFLMDNPQFFFLDRTYSLEGLEKDGKTVYDTILLHFTLNLKERQEAIQRLNVAVEAATRHCPDTTDEYEIEKYYHDYLINVCTYDDEAANNGSSAYENAYSAYGALVDGRAVCEGYAKAMQLLLHRSAITATVVMGRSIDDWEAHMWNLVRINGSYYYVDVTWDDTDDFPQHTYFNMNLEALQRTHCLDEHQLTDIVCNSTTESYFVRNHTYLDTYEREVIAGAIAQQVKNGATVIQLQFAPGKYENALLFLKNMSLTQRMTNNQLANHMTLWNYNLSTHAKQHVITLIQSA